MSSATSQQNNLTWTNTAGTISLTSTRLYKIDLSVSWWFSGITQGSWILNLIDNSGNTIATRIFENSNGDNVSVALSAFVTGQTSVYATLQFTGTATSGDDTIPEMSCQIVATEY